MSDTDSDSDDTVIEQVSDPEDVTETEAPEDVPPVPLGGRPRRNIVPPARLQDYLVDMPNHRAELAEAVVCSIT